MSRTNEDSDTLCCFTAVRAKFSERVRDQDFAQGVFVFYLRRQRGEVFVCITIKRFGRGVALLCGVMGISPLPSSETSPSPPTPTVRPIALYTVVPSPSSISTVSLKIHTVSSCRFILHKFEVLGTQSKRLQDPVSQLLQFAHHLRRLAFPCLSCPSW